MKIVTLIPAYKPQYIDSLFNSLSNQTIKSSRIIISDDSPNGEYTRALEAKGILNLLNIEIVQGNRIGGYENFKHLIRIYNQSSDLVHLMLDDDFIYPFFYERHLEAHDKIICSCSISARWQSDEEGSIVCGQNPPEQIKNSEFRLNSINKELIFSSTIAECKNWLGEFSNTVMKNDSCKLLLDPKLNDISYAGLWDLGYFISASLTSPIAYINDYLGAFRAGTDNNSSKIFGPYMKSAFVAYAALTLGAQRGNHLSREQAINCYNIISNFIKYHYSSQIDMDHLSKVISLLTNDQDNAEHLFVNSWNSFINRNKL